MVSNGQCGVEALHVWKLIWLSVKLCLEVHTVYGNTVSQGACLQLIVSSLSER